MTDDENRRLPPLAVAFQSFGLLVFEGLSLGLAAWTLRAGERLGPYVASNTLSRMGRNYLIGNMAAAAAVLMAAAIVLIAWKKSEGLEIVRRASRRMAPLALAGFIPLLLRWQLWVDHELAFATLASAFALALQGLLRISLATPAVFENRFPNLLARLRLPRMTLARPAWLPLALVCAGALTYAVFFSFHTITNHYNLGTSAFDLGLEDNLIWNAIHGGHLFKSAPFAWPDGTHGGNHQTYIAYVLGLIYAIVPRPQTLLVIQAALLAAAAIPLFFLARRRLGPAIACLVAFAYLLYPPLHGANLYDFHYLPLGVFSVWSALYFLEERRDRWAALAIVLALATREDVAGMLAVFGVYLVVTGERPRAGLIVTAIGMGYFVVMKFIVMPRFTAGGEAFDYMYAGLIPEGHGGFAGVLKTVFGNPAFTLESLLTKEKILYLLQIMSPLAFLPWRHRAGLLFSVPGFFFTLLSTNNPGLVQTSFQYTTYWTMFVFIGVIHVLDRLGQGTDPARKLSQRAWIATLAAAMIVATHQNGALLQQHTIRGGFGVYRFGTTEADHQHHHDLYALIAQLPPRAKVAASETLVPHVSSRPNAYTIRVGMFDADYILSWIPPRSDELGPVVTALKKDGFGVVDQKGSFFLARRGFSQVKNAALIARIE